MHKGDLCNDYRPFEITHNKIQRKKLTYEDKRDLIFRVMYWNENLRLVCHDLKINFSTGRNLLQKYKKTGEFFERDALYCSKGYWNFPHVHNEENPACNLNLILLSENKIDVIKTKCYNREEEQLLIQMHNYFINNGII